MPITMREWCSFHLPSPHLTAELLFRAAVLILLFYLSGSVLVVFYHLFTDSHTLMVIFEVGALPCFGMTLSLLSLSYGFKPWDDAPPSYGFIGSAVSAAAWLPAFIAFLILR